EAKEVLPSVLPPLRGDVPTLVVGKLAGKVADLAYTVTGESSGKEFSQKVSHKVPASEADHIFLTQIHGQWKARKDRPALLQADRALAYAQTQHYLAVEDLLAKAEMAIEQNNIDLAHKLYDQVQQLDPGNVRAKGGVSLIDEMRKGKLNREDM